MSALMEWVRLNGPLLGFVAIIVLVYLFLGSSPTPGITSSETLNQSLTSGQPVVLDFYSNFWTTCYVSKPIVDRIETGLDGKAEVIRLNLLSEVGREAALRYGVRAVPSLVVVDGQGALVYGSYGLPKPSQVTEEVEALLAEN